MRAWVHQAEITAGYPVKLHPFIEAEKVTGHSVNHACGLLDVSRAAYYQRRNGEASMREVTDAELTEKITAVTKSSRAPMGRPVATENCVTAALAAESAGSPA